MPYFPPLLPDLCNIRYKRPARNAVGHLSVRFLKMAQGIPYLLHERKWNCINSCTVKPCDILKAIECCLPRHGARLNLMLRQRGFVIGCTLVRDIRRSNANCRQHGYQALFYFLYRSRNSKETMTCYHVGRRFLARSLAHIPRKSRCPVEWNGFNNRAGRVGGRAR